jgi:enoyl-CoA hydratase/carnithine racemase
MSNSVRTSLHDSICTITLARADKRNALNEEMYGLLATALVAASQDPATRVVLVEAEGVDFCSGNDIADFLQFASSGRSLVDADVVRMIEQLTQLEKPVVAAVQGRAVGIGFTMLLHCDVVCLADNAELSAPFVRLGVTPEAASSLLLPARMGHARAFEVFALGRSVPAAEALQLGLANRVVPTTELAATARQLAAALAAQPPEAVRATKRLLRDSAALLATARREQAIFDERFRSPEAQAVFASFARKGR